MTKKKKTNLTNEELTKLYSNPFELVSNAIKIAHQVVGSGRELKDSTTKNVATQILNKILKDHETAEQSQEMLKKDHTPSASHGKDFPDPMLQAV